MWRVMWEVGKLSREDLGKMCQMGFKDHTKSGGRGLNFTPVHLPHMYDDVKNFLGLLKHIHGGTDLFSLCEACKGQYPDHDSECLAFDIFHSRDDPYSLGKILDLRRRLESVRWKRDILMLDVAMEDQLRSLAERADPSTMGRDEILNLICMILEDLMVSRHDPSLQQGFELLDRLSRGDAGGLQKWSPEWCKMLHASCDRLALACTDTADTVMRVLQECADRLLEEGAKPGAAFSPDPKHLETFGEEKARCLTERVLAQILKVLMPQLRRWAGLGPWQLVASFPALGTLRPIASLPAELAPGQAPMIALVETMTGWEDIPAGITAILLPAGQAVDTLSHVAIRARNQQVLLASCDEEATLAELRGLSGTPLRLQVSASGDVTWEKAALPAEASAATPAPTRLAETMQKPPKPPSLVLASPDFTKNTRSIGGKSLHLAELAAASGQFAVPNSATVPYGVFEQILGDGANEGLLEELEEILGEGQL
ncbi:R1, partial [Symbiodinium natans]